MFNWIFGRSSSSGCPQASGSKKRKLAELSDGPSSSASLQDCEAKHRRKEAQQVNDSLDQLGEQSDAPTMQILFFHGLPLEDVSNVHLETWDSGDGFIWPQAWLVEEFPGAHIFFVKYGVALKNANFDMNNIGENLISDLLQANVGQVRGCPVVLVGHCIGGLVIKQLCLKAHELHSVETSRIDRAKMLAAFLNNMKGIFYYSTPHVGIREITKATHLRQSPLFKFFETLSTRAAVLNSNFDNLRKRYSRWRVEGVGESLDVELGVFKNTLVVEEASSRVGVDIFNLLKEDHFSISKPKEKISGGYYHLTSLLSNIAKEEIKLQEETSPENIQQLPKSIVGIEIPLQDVKEKLKEVSTLGLTGMGGSGKTTLAKAVFNELGCKFEYTCFVPDVKFITGRVETLKEEVWKHLYCNGKKVIGDMCWSQLSGKRLLLILDDISDGRDVTVLSEIAQGPSVESRYIATSRDSNLFEFFYTIPLLDGNIHGRELFMSCAFPNNEARPSKLMNLVGKIVKKCGGLPLTLEVLGKWLRKTYDQEHWEQTLHALDKAERVTNFNERLWDKLRPSIDGLEENKKQMFLDATTFFFDGLWTLRQAKVAWREAYYGVSELLWQTLVDRSLVYNVREDEVIKVHEQLRSLGRKIANESNHNIDIRTLEDLKLLQSSNELEKKNIHALRIEMDLTDGEENHARQSTADDRESEQISSVDGKIHVTSLALQELKELRYLEIHNKGEIDGAAEVILFPSRVALLRCFGVKILNFFHQRHLAVLEIWAVESLPSSIGQLSALRFLTLRDASLTSIPEEIGDLSKLEVLRISECSVETLPDKLGLLSKLRILRISDCRNLRTLPESFGKLCSLQKLHFLQCRFETLPESFGHLAALVELGFTECDSLKSLPQTFGQLSALRRLDFFQCNHLQSLPESFGKLSALNYLRFQFCNRLESLPESFGLLGALVDLGLDDCDNLECLPKTFGHLSSLSRLEFQRCSRLQSLPESFGKLSALNYLRFQFCNRLESLPESFGLLCALVGLEFIGCDNLECLPKTFGHLSSLSRLEFQQCSRLQSLPESFGKLSALNYLRFHLCNRLESLPESFGLLCALVDLGFDVCDNLECLPKTFGHLSSLSRLEFRACSRLQSLPESFGKLSALNDLRFQYCNRLESLPESFGLLGALVDLEFIGCDNLECLPKTFGHLSSLSRLEFRACSRLQSLPESFGKLSALNYLRFQFCNRLESLPESFGLLCALVGLEFIGCDNLECLPKTFGHLSSLSRLEFQQCSRLQSLPESFGKLSALNYLRFHLCNRLESLPESFGLLCALVDLGFDVCDNLECLPKTFGHLSSLSRLEFRACSRLQSLPESFGKLSALNDLRFQYCNRLESLPESFGLLGALVDLEFIGCDNLECLPKTFGHLSSLSRLEFRACSRLQSLPESFGKLSALNDLRFQYCNRLESLPESFGLLGALVDLEFIGCDNLECLPKTFGHLSSLSRLEFRACSRLQSLPESFGKLSALNDLRFQYCNRLESLPESFGLLGALVDLEFNDCDNLECLPKTFGHLSALSRLEFEGCSRLRSLPESLGNLPGLRHLKLSRCSGLHHLPESLGRLAKLEYLEIDDLEELKSLPDSVAELGSLRHLKITNLCPLKRIPDYIRNLPSLHTLELGELPHIKELPPWLGETGVNYLPQSRKVFRIQDRQFSLTRDETVKPSGFVKNIQSRAMKKVRKSDYEGALAGLEVSSVGIPELDGFLLQEKGIIKRKMGDLGGALDDLTAALECFSKTDNGHHYSYDCWKHRGYVKFLMEDMEGAENDGTMAVKLQLDYRESVLSARGWDSLGEEVLEYMYFRLEGSKEMRQHEDLLHSASSEVLQKVKVADFQGALASFDVINVRLLRYQARGFFLQERGVLKRLAGDLGGALEDLTVALEMDGDDYACLKHRGYVKYLLGDLDGARLDAERCLKVGLPDYYPGAEVLGEASVAFMEFNLE